jgi:pilus assembly protein CpaE
MSDLNHGIPSNAPQTGNGKTPPNLLLQSVGVVPSAIGGEARLPALKALFPGIAFEAVDENVAVVDSSKYDVLIIPVDKDSIPDVQKLLQRLSAGSAQTKIITALRGADVATIRELVHTGVADVLPEPVTDPILALSLERILAKQAAGGGAKQGHGKIIAMMKAGGGVGATSLGVQLGLLLAERHQTDVCFADLDVQFGLAEIYLDIPDSISIVDCLRSGSNLAETPFPSTLAKHSSGLRLLAAPKEVVALDTMTAEIANALMTGMRRDFQTTIVDLPTEWTAWSNQVLQNADHIVLVTHLTVPHVQIMKRQLRVIEAQHLNDRPLTLVCNAVSQDHLHALPLKSAERGIGRKFDCVIPEDRKTMLSAVNQGMDKSISKQSTKIAKSITSLADVMNGTLTLNGFKESARQAWR